MAASEEVDIVLTFKNAVAPGMSKNATETGRASAAMQRYNTDVKAVELAQKKLNKAAKDGGEVIEEASQKIIDVTKRAGEFGATEEQNAKILDDIARAAGRTGKPISLVARAYEELLIETHDAEKAQKLFAKAMVRVQKTGDRTEIVVAELVDATRGGTAALKRYGEVGARVAAEIDKITDPAERARRTLKALDRLENRSIGTLEKFNNKLIGAQADLAGLTASLGPAAVGVGALGAAAVLTGGFILKFGVDAVKKYAKTNEEAKLSLDVLSSSLDNFSVEVGHALFETAKLEDVIYGVGDATLIATDRATALIRQYKELSGVSKGVVNVLTFGTAGLAEFAGKKLSEMGKQGPTRDRAAGLRTLRDANRKAARAGGGGGGGGGSLEDRRRAAAEKILALHEKEKALNERLTVRGPRLAQIADMKALAAETERYQLKIDDLSGKILALEQARPETKKHLRPGLDKRISQLKDELEVAKTSERDFAKATERARGFRREVDEMLRVIQNTVPIDTSLAGFVTFESQAAEFRRRGAVALARGFKDQAESYKRVAIAADQSAERTARIRSETEQLREEYAQLAEQINVTRDASIRFGEGFAESIGSIVAASGDLSDVRQALGREVGGIGGTLGALFGGPVGGIVGGGISSFLGGIISGDAEKEKRETSSKRIDEASRRFEESTETFKDVVEGGQEVNFTFNIGIARQVIQREVRSAILEGRRTRTIS